MNREIKFRGKVKYNGNHYDSGDWVKGTGIKLEGDKTFIFDDEENYVNSLGDFTRNEWAEVIPETIGQFTGLKDKNGKEIYEGDIIEIVNNLDEVTKQYKNNTLVKFRDCAFVSAWQGLRFDGTYGEVYNHFSNYNTPVVTFEVIGNIYTIIQNCWRGRMKRKEHDHEKI